jgi:hypothetical protein
VPPFFRPVLLAALYLTLSPIVLAQSESAETIIRQPISPLDEVQVLDWLSFRGHQDILEVIAGGTNPPETPVSRLRLTFQRPVQLEKIPHVVYVFESSAFIHGGPPSPLVIVLMNLDYEVVQWARLESFVSMGAAFVRYFLADMGAPWHGKTAELVLVGQSGRSLTGSLFFYRVSLSREKVAFVGAGTEWKPNE